MKFDEFMLKVLELVAEATVEEDEDGQLVINTGLTLTTDNEVIPMEEE